MSEFHRINRSRRAVLRAGVAAGACAVLQPLSSLAADASSLPPILRTIPSTREQIPVVGIGTNQFDVTSPQDIAARREVLQSMPQLGGRLIDTLADMAARKRSSAPCSQSSATAIAFSSPPSRFGPAGRCADHPGAAG
ncbi:MAG: hypothetical protein WDO56_35955 [Gammaproteobacteria bacterium]